MNSFGLACTASARATLQNARKLGVDGQIFDEDDDGHVYVVLEGMENEALALNSEYKNLSVSEVRLKGSDVTSEIMNSEWKSITKTVFFKTLSPPLSPHNSVLDFG